MENPVNNKVYVGVAIVVFLTILYFFINYRVKNILRHELHKIRERRNKKIRIAQEKNKRSVSQHIKNQQIMTDHAIDSYFDPAENQEQDQDREDDNDDGVVQRLTKDNIGTRDFTDGTR